MDMHQFIKRVTSDPAFAADIQAKAHSVREHGTSSPEFDSLMGHFANDPQELAEIRTNFTASGFTTVTTLTTGTSAGCLTTTTTTTTGGK